ncbi:MAG: hypothetical protein ABIO60_10320 [Aquaticitalea sp.]
MKVINLHRRIIHQSMESVSGLLQTLATKEDKIWPFEHWPAIRFRDGLTVGSQGGHGLIGYTIIEYELRKSIKFKFTKPKGFNGAHQLVIIPSDSKSVEIVHRIEMQTSGFATTFWLLAVRWLHDALIEEAFDKLESNFSNENNRITYSLWVRFLRYHLRPNKNRTS